MDTHDGKSLASQKTPEVDRRYPAPPVGSHVAGWVPGVSPRSVESPNYLIRVRHFWLRHIVQLRHLLNCCKQEVDLNHDNNASL